MIIALACRRDGSNPHRSASHSDNQTPATRREKLPAGISATKWKWPQDDRFFPTLPALSPQRIIGGNGSRSAGYRHQPPS